jgi:hypothetical protein
MGEAKSTCGTAAEPGHASAAAHPGETSSATFYEQSGERETTVIIRDITERKRAEEFLHNMRAEITDVTRVRLSKKRWP